MSAGNDCNIFISEVEQDTSPHRESNINLGLLVLCISFLLGLPLGVRELNSLWVQLGAFRVSDPQPCTFEAASADPAFLSRYGAVPGVTVKTLTENDWHHYREPTAR
jgi:hypothetical protein